MSRKLHKHKLIFDEGFHLPHSLPITNSRFTIKHIASGYKKSGLSDAKIYDLARKEKKLLITYNVKDFVKFINRPTDPGIIGISPNLSLEQIDKKLTALLIRSSVKELKGKLTYISGEFKKEK